MIKLFMWSGPRNISTALMRSFENRSDTKVYDEPFYAYYLKHTNLNHPMKDEILKTYPSDENEVIKLVNKEDEKYEIFYQKHMSHHILDFTNLEWINNGINCFLIRDPAKVISSYIKKNTINSIKDIGFKKLYEIFKSLNSKDSIVINTDYLLENPEKYLKILCKILNLDFDKNMLNWPKGYRNTDGIWSKVWYQDVISSTTFNTISNKEYIVPKSYENIYKECLKIYEEINKYSIRI